METKGSKVSSISEKIKEYIISNNLEVGTKLPNEYELAKILEVGRGTLREGIRELVTQNVLIIKRGSGTYILSKKGTLNDPLGLEFLKDKEKLIEDILQVRLMIEPYIAMNAALYATKEEVKKIENLCDEVEELINTGENYLFKDVEFHTEIAKSCGNTIMPRLIPIINQSIYLFGTTTKLSLKESTRIVHRDIVEAIKNGDAVAAHDAMYLHILSNRRRINKLNRDLL